MKLHVLSENLQKKLSFVNHAVSSRSQLPILLHVLLETKEGRLHISATDLEIGIETKIPASIEEEGGITVPAKLFLELINSISADKITLETKETTLEVIGGRTKSKLQGMNKDEFPSLYEETGEEIMRLHTDALKKNFSRVVFAASIDTTRPALSGVLIKKSETGFLIVATDGYRLSLQKNENTNGIMKSTELSKPLLMPARVIREAIGLKDGDNVTLFVSQTSNQILFQQDDTVLIGRLIEAEYPNYEKILPSDFSTKVFFDREEMQKAIKTCAIFARETANIVKLSLKKDMVVVSANTPAVGDNIVEVEAKLQGEENEIAFNAKYLLDLFANVDAEQMSFEMSGPLNPGVFRIADDQNFLHLIMPIRTQG